MKKAFNFIIGFLFTLLAVAYVGALLAIIISPKLAWPFAFLGLGFHVLFFFMLIFLVVWLVTKSKRVVWPILFIALSFFVVPNFFNLSTNKTQKGEQAKDNLKIMSYNVRIFEAYDRENANEKRDKILEFIQTQQPDILCLQEAMSKRNFLTTEQLSEQLQMPYVYFEVGTISKSGSEFGVSVLSKYPIQHLDSYKFSSGGNVGTKVQVKTPDGPITVFNIHLESINIESSYYNYGSKEMAKISEQPYIMRAKRVANQLREAFTKRSGQAEQMREAIQSTEGPVIVCGDFNDHPVSYAYSTVKGKLKDTFKAGKFGFGNTLTAIPLLRIDHIFVSNHFKVASHTIYQKELSDHYPVVTQVEIKQ